MTGPIEPYRKANLLERIQSEHQKLETLLACLDENRMTQPGLVGAWSIKDILAHIAAWERCMLHWVGETRQGLTPRLPTSKHDLHRWNARFYQENQPRPLAEVLAEFHQSYQEVLKSGCVSISGRGTGELRVTWVRSTHVTLNSPPFPWN